MKKIFIILATLTTLNLSDTTLANTCGEWQSKLKTAQRKLNETSNQSQIRQRTKEHNYYKSELDKCNKKNGSHRWIQISSGQKQPLASRQVREKLRPINTENAKLRQIISTCNYWIAQYNKNTTDDNLSFKNTACMNADKSAQDLNAEQEKAAGLNIAVKSSDISDNRRTLKECIKPNNLIDTDVRRCMEGDTTPK